MSRERDKRIAELKGWQWTKEDGWYHKEKDVWVWFMPKWSTNRNDALELWDEFPTENGYHKYYWQMCKKHVIVIAYDGSDVIRKEGTSFADAVSKTWEQWKGENK